MKKTLFLIVAALFICAAAEVCSDNSCAVDTAHHCLACCGSVCCNYIIASQAAPKPHITASIAVASRSTSYKNIFVSDVDRPPADI